MTENLTTPHENQMLSAALRYAAGGWPVFPCAPRGKVPITSHGCKDATLDAEQIRSWWSSTPDANIGLATGAASGVFVLDVDEKPDQSAEESIAGFPEKLPDCPTVRTPRGGCHFYFKDLPGASITAGKLGKGLDTRGEGGYVIAPPSVSADGRGYAWIDSDDVCGLPEVPQWLVERLAKKPEKKEGSAELIAPGAGRHATLVTAAGIMRQNGFVTSEINAALLAMRARLDLSDGRVITDLEVKNIADWVGQKPAGMASPDAIAHGGEIIDSLAAGMAAEASAAWSFRTHEDRMRDRYAPLPGVIDEVLPQGGIGAIIALPGVGKSLLALEVARCVATGSPFAGKAVLRGRVIYACPDSPASTERRMLAMPESAQANILSVVSPPSFPDGIESLRGALLGLISTPGDAVRLICVDTWDSAREHSGGGYADQDGDAERVMRALRSLSEELGLAVLVVHHATRADTGRARGTVVFDARCDMIGLAEAVSGGVKMQITKSRDGESGPLGEWTIVPIDVGGRSVPTLVEVTKSVSDGAVGTLSAGQTKLLKSLILLGGGASKASLSELADLAGYAAKSAVSKAIDGLRMAGLVEANTYQPTPFGSLYLSAPKCD